jgi:hypothetical protein
MREALVSLDELRSTNVEGLRFTRVASARIAIHFRASAGKTRGAGISPQAKAAF